MARWPLLGGAYMAEGIIANAQRCINLYPERNPIDSPTPVTHYPTPGLEHLLDGYGAGRGLYTASDGTLYGCSGNTVFWINASGVLAVLGTIPSLLTPVKFVDNGTSLIVLDGASAWIVNMETKAWAEYTDLTEVVTGGAYLDTFLLFNVANTNEFVSSDSNLTTFDPLYIASKTSYPDHLVLPVAVHRELWLIGKQTSEIWTSVANQDFPFQIIPGAFVQYGCVAPYSIATADVSVFWLSQNPQGVGMVVRGKGYSIERISTHAIEWEIQKYEDISDAVAYTYQENGHIFYVLSFPSADKTWVYDESIGLWHERAWMDTEGKLHRHRVMSGTQAYGRLWGMDWETGNIYRMGSSIYTDADAPIVRVRSFPHLKEIRAERGVVNLEGKRIKFDKFIADIEVGNLPETTLELWPSPAPGLLEYDDPNQPIQRLLLGDAGADDFGILLDNYLVGTPGPRIILRWSNTRGASWQGSLMNTLGSSGQYLTQPMWRRLGFARDRVWELSWTAPCKTALNGAWVEMRVMKI